MKIKYLLSFALVFGMSFVNSPNSTALTVNDPDKPGTPTVGYSFNRYGFIVGAAKSIDPGMLIYPKFNCDPKMCITTVPDIDPGIKIRDLP